MAGCGPVELEDPAILNLIPMLFDRLKQGKAPAIFGDDYPTPDGTCVRDYIHVSDLADAHLAALKYLDRDERKYDVFNVGTGEGTSVRQIVDEVKKVTGLPFTETVMPRRAGDPPHLIGPRRTQVRRLQRRHRRRHLGAPDRGRGQEGDRPAVHRDRHAAPRRRPAAPDRLAEAHQRGDGLACQVRRRRHRGVCVERVAGQSGPLHRRGDLEGSPKRINEEMGWRAKYDVEDIVESAWNAWQANPDHYIDVETWKQHD